MTLTEEKIKTTNPNIRDNAIRQEGKIRLSIFNYCFFAYFHLINEIKKKSSFAKGTLLDVGSGSCPFEKYFSNHVEKYLKHEHPHAQRENIHYDYVSELPKINAPGNTFDTVVCFSVLEHVSEPFETIKEINRILKENGTLILSVPQYWHLHDEPYDFLRFTKYSLIEKISNSGFKILYIKELGKSFSVVGQAFCNAIILHFNLNHVKNIFNLFNGRNTKRDPETPLTASLLYALYKSPLILLAIILIPIINILFLSLDLIFGSPRDTIGYFVIARKR